MTSDCEFGIEFNTNLRSIYRFSDNGRKYYYFKTYNRTAPWLIGIAFGGFVLNGDIRRKKYKIGKVK